ncbi:hypothetical protein FF38_11620 [Lucilia cuprina]|uniref:Transmembrane protein n=1 Tax=Lucilia cuprina TaxID=7375 RepID=A0A0L0BVI6_LUCCU|nr:hypothetical protein FF38_11620 [Lucilia cuprina]
MQCKKLSCKKPRKKDLMFPTATTYCSQPKISLKWFCDLNITTTVVMGQQLRQKAINTIPNGMTEQIYEKNNGAYYKFLIVSCVCWCHSHFWPSKQILLFGTEQTTAVSSSSSPRAALPPLPSQQQIQYQHHRYDDNALTMIVMAGLMLTMITTTMLNMLMNDRMGGRNGSDEWVQCNLKKAYLMKCSQPTKQSFSETNVGAFFLVKLTT